MARIRSHMRYELKYLLRREQAERLAGALCTHMAVDSHGDERGVYPITSLYYDTPDYKAYWDKIDGQRSRRKVRVRVYGGQAITPDTAAFVEIKQRINKMMCKRRAVLPYQQAVAFDDFEMLAADCDGPEAALLREVYYLYRTLQLRPACVVTYDRMAFEGNELYPDLRVTLDSNLRGRIHDLSLLSTGAATNQRVFDPTYVVLEVKANANVPSWLAQLLADHHCTFFRISKYCLVLEHSKVIAGRQHIIQR